MRILVLSERFYPEEFLINDLVSEWIKQGHIIDVITQVPSYPYDRIYDNYKNHIYQTTNEWKGVTIHRVRTVLGYNSSVKRKVLNYVSFAFLTSLWAIIFGWKYDRVFAFHSGPLTMALAGVPLRFLWWRKCMIWTQDVWPDTVYAYGIKKTWITQKLLGILVWFIYKGYKSISVSCPGFIGKITPYMNRKVLYFPQWSFPNSPAISIIPHTKRVFTFAGNIGSVQNLEVLIDVFGSMRLSNSILQIVGDGIYLSKLKELVKENNYNNIEFTGRLPREKMPDVFAGSDVLIISLKSEFDLTIPAKFQAYIASGRPILGVVRGDTAKLINDYNLGLSADPDNRKEIADAFTKMAEASQEQIIEWQSNALKMSNSEFSRENIVGKITNSLFSI